MRAIKYVLITLLLFAGVAFLYAGMGINIPAVEYGNVASYGVAVGITFLLLAVMVARFWEDQTASGTKGR